MKALTRGAKKAVAGGVIFEFILAEQARLDRGTTLGPRHVGFKPGLLASLDILNLKITFVGNDRNFLDPENLLRRFRGLRQQAHVNDLVGDLLLHD